MTRSHGCWLAALLSLPTAFAPVRAEDAAQVTLTIERLAAVERRETGPALGYVSGRALAHRGDLQLFDVVFVIDTSRSTSAASGVDLGRQRWGGRVGRMMQRKQSSILGAEVTAVEALLDHFDPRTTRVGLVSFNGRDVPGADHAWLEVPLTSEYSRVRTGLGVILIAGPDGDTNMSAGLKLAGIELRGARAAESEPRSTAARHIVLLTDGKPTLPGEDPEDRTIRRARRLGRQQIRVHTFAIGPEATRQPRAAVEVASVTGGSYTAVRDPRDLQSMLAQVDFSDLREVRVSNRTLGRRATELVRNPDGTYGALVPIARGKNRIALVAVARDGVEHRVERTLSVDGEPMTARQRREQRRLLGGERQRDIQILVEQGDPAD